MTDRVLGIATCIGMAMNSHRNIRTYSIRYGHASAPDASAAAADATASLKLAISAWTVRWITGDRDVKDREPLHALVATTSM